MLTDFQLLALLPILAFLVIALFGRWYFRRKERYLYMSKAEVLSEISIFLFDLSKRRVLVVDGITSKRYIQLKTFSDSLDTLGAYWDIPLDSQLFADKVVAFCEENHLTYQRVSFENLGVLEVSIDPHKPDTIEKLVDFVFPDVEVYKAWEAPYSGANYA